MNPILVHLLYLISRHDCVIVPGFGAFLSEEIPARINEETLTAYPASRRVRFNGELNSDDGLLQHSLARRDRISYQEARREIDRSVETLCERLRNGEKIEIEGLGLFSLSAEGQKVFTPYETGASNTVSLPLMVSSEKIQSSGLLPFRKMLIRVACALTIIILAAAALLLPTGVPGTEVNRASVIPVETLLNIGSKHDTPIVPDVDLNAGTPVEKCLSREEQRYQLIVGTFSTREEAEKFIARQEDDTTALTPVCGRGKTWRVSVMSGEEREPLQKELNRLSKRFEGIWIWEKL